MPPVYPGAILREDILKEMKLSITKTAENLQVSRKQLSEVVNEGAAISAEMACAWKMLLELVRNFGLICRKLTIYGRLSKAGAYMVSAGFSMNMSVTLLRCCLKLIMERCRGCIISHFGQ